VEGAAVLFFSQPTGNFKKRQMFPTLIRKQEEPWLQGLIKYAADIMYEGNALCA